jgi:hypothetical protein
VKLNHRGRSALVDSAVQLVSSERRPTVERLAALDDIATVVDVPVERVRSTLQRRGGSDAALAV